MLICLSNHGEMKALANHVVMVDVRGSPKTTVVFMVH